MENGIVVQNGIIIPEHELEITTSRSGGPGGQHVNKSDTRITLRWNVRNTQALSEEQKERVLQKLYNRLTTEGELIIHASQSRSQYENKKRAFELLTNILRDALYIPKKRKKSGIPQTIKEARLKEKKQRSFLKKLRSHKNYEE